MQSTQEIWKPIPDYEGLYEVSNSGRVKCLSREYISGNPQHTTTIQEKIMSPGRMNGYKILGLRKEGVRKTYKISRLVAIAFIPKDDPRKVVVNHKNGVRDDDRVGNLEWCTQKENIVHSWEHLDRRAQNRKEVGRYDLEGNFIESFSSTVHAGEAGFDDSKVSAVCLGKRKTHGGSLWKYL